MGSSKLEDMQITSVNMVIGSSCALKLTVLPCNLTSKRHEFFVKFDRINKWLQGEPEFQEMSNWPDHLQTSTIPSHFLQLIEMINVNNDNTLNNFLTLRTRESKDPSPTM
ncbi:hypothetical protein BPOR_0460g00100 [Botrytis porri]|uniref:Uncharacterized protein n=1 Tax=Botrytis porri TaxID=87229 RepID=A0A4Z1KMK4_9HELO|nr:hypothetical protein BPOR_0460g00100 [Botrytis porri]